MCFFYKHILILLFTGQSECHPALPQQQVREYCKSKGIYFQAYSSLGCGQVSVQGRCGLTSSALISLSHWVVGDLNVSTFSINNNSNNNNNNNNNNS